MIPTSELCKALDACTTLDTLRILRDRLDDYLTPQQHVLMFERLTILLSTLDENEEGCDEDDAVIGDDSRAVDVQQGGHGVSPSANPVQPTTTAPQQPTDVPSTSGVQSSTYVPSTLRIQSSQDIPSGSQHKISTVDVPSTSGTQQISRQDQPSTSRGTQSNKRHHGDVIRNVDDDDGEERLPAYNISKIMTKVADFAIDDDLLEDFIRPPMVTLAEAKGSAQKRRLSVCGHVTEVGECIKTSTYKRRCLTLSDDGSSMDVILWGEVAEEKVECGERVCVTALMKDGRRLNSTGSSVVEEVQSEESRGTIIGLGDPETGYPVEAILESGNSIYIEEAASFDFSRVELPVNIVYVLQAGDHVKTISVEED